MNDGVKIKRISGRVALFLEEDATFEDACRIADQIAGVPGIARVSSGYRCAQELECMYDTAIKALSDAGEFDTFKVSARRNHTDFPIDSMQLNQLVGGALCRAFPDKSVRMKNPDVEVRVEVIQGYTYIYGRSIPGIGGLPVGSAGKAVCLLSSGIDSPVATWRIARRGATCIGVHFSGRPETSATSEYLLEDIAEVLERTVALRVCMLFQLEPINVRSLLSYHLNCALSCIADSCSRLLKRLPEKKVQRRWLLVKAWDKLLRRRWITCW